MQGTTQGMQKCLQMMEQQVATYLGDPMLKRSLAVLKTQHPKTEELAKDTQ